MGGDTLVNNIDGEIIDANDINVIHRVLEGDFVGRDSSGAPTPLQNLGTPTIPWGTARVTSLILDGLPVDPGIITAPPNRVISGPIRATSEFPDYLRPAGSGASFTVLGATTPIDIDVNGVTAQIATDIVKSSLTVAPAANNTCLINDTGLSGQDPTRFLGENKTGITVDNMGSELTGKIGQFVALLNQTTSEIIYCRIASATRLDYARRGFFFNSSGNPVAANVLVNNDVLQILSLGFIFAEDNGVTIDVTYRNPTIDGNQPSSPQTGDYWYDLAVNVWKRYSGVSFDQIDRTFIGVAVIDTVNCIGARPEYFSKSYADSNSLKVFLDTVDVIAADTADFIASVDGEDLRFDFSFFQWVAASDFESGVSRTISRDYWLYITEKGKPIISNKKPYDLLGFLRGWYHPYESWRAVAQVYNNASDEFELVNESDESLELLDGPLTLPKIAPIANNAIDAANDIDFSPRVFTFDDGPGEARILQTLTKKLDVNWSEGDNQGMLDTGAKAANTTYFTFDIHNLKTGVSDYLASLSPTTPTMPAGFTKKRRNGAILTDAGLNISGFQQVGKRFIRNFNVLDVNIVTSPMPVARAAYPLTVPVGVSVLAQMAVYIAIGSGAAVNLSYRFTDLNKPDDPPSVGIPFTTFDIAIGHVNAHGAQVSSYIEKNTDTSGQIGITGSQTATGDFQVNTVSWVDYLLEA